LQFFFNVLLALLANVSAAPNGRSNDGRNARTHGHPTWYSAIGSKEATTGAMRARSEVSGGCFKYNVRPCVRCVATKSPHAGLASCIAPVVAVVAPANDLLFKQFDRRATHLKSKISTH
jgi:hypothetical protein